jgi:alkyl hydroperoxide reductase subunit AhpC
VKLNSLLTKKEKRLVQILAVSIDSHEISKKFAQHLSEGLPEKFDIPMLEDKNHKVIDRYGIFNPDGRGWPHPANYVIDKQGVVRWKFVEVDYTQRPSNDQILQALRAIP